MMRALLAAALMACFVYPASAEVQIKYNFTGGIEAKKREPAIKPRKRTGSPFAAVSAPRRRVNAVARPPAPPAPFTPQYVSTYTGMEIVPFNRAVKPGTLIINTAERRLYRVLPGGMAEKYGIGVGREGFTWRGTKRISRKAEWPAWTPPATMIERERAKGINLPAYMPGGPNNPLGARAMYLGGSLFRIHGTNQPNTIGHAVSSGCIRMLNEEVIALYDKVDVGTLVIVE